MNKSNRFCTIQGHEGYSVYQICTSIDCKQITRWCCSECLSIGIHYHNKSNNLHIMNREEFVNKFQNEYENIKKDYFCKESTRQYNLLGIILKECQKIQNILIDYMTYDSIIQQLEQIESIIEIYQDDKKDKNDKIDKNDKNDISNSIIDLKDRKYIIQEFDQTKNTYYASTISKNQQYLAYGADKDKILKIYDIKQQKLMKEIKLDQFLYVCQFTEDSSQLYIGLQEGYVCGYGVKVIILKNACDQTQQFKYIITICNLNSIIRQILQLNCELLKEYLFKNIKLSKYLKNY